MLYRYIKDSLAHRNVCEDIAKAKASSRKRCDACVFSDDPMAQNWTGIPAAFIQVMWHDPERMETVIGYEYPPEALALNETQIASR